MFEIDKEFIEKAELAHEYFIRLTETPDFKASLIYLQSLEQLLGNPEFCKSEKWVLYLKDQIKIMDYLLDDSQYNPMDAEKLREKFITEDALKTARKETSERASNKRHDENRKAKKMAVDFYKEHYSEFNNKDEAAFLIKTKIVGYSFVTVRGWLKGIDPESS